MSTGCVSARVLDQIDHLAGVRGHYSNTTSKGFSFSTDPNRENLGMIGDDTIHALTSELISIKCMFPVERIGKLVHSLCRASIGVCDFKHELSSNNDARAVPSRMVRAERPHWSHRMRGSRRDEFTRPFVWIDQDKQVFSNTLS